MTAAAKQIAEETRHKIVMGLLSSLATHVPDLRTDRVFTTFQVRRAGFGEPQQAGRGQQQDALHALS